MPVNYPKFDKKIQDQIDGTILRLPKTRPGTIMGYDSSTNLATIVLDEQNSDAIGNVIHSVPCPVTRGIQAVSPTVGTRCLVGFRDNNETNPYVLNYFDDITTRTNSIYNSVLSTGVPRFMV